VKKKILVLSLLSLPLVFTLGACGDKKSPTDTVTVSESGESEIVTPDSNLDNLVYLDKSVIYNGNEQELVLDSIPSGYHVTYLNNKGTKQGKYFAKAKVYDSNNTLRKVLNAVLIIDNPANTEFEEFLNEYFVEKLGTDAYNWNVFTIDSSKFGRKREDLTASWYKYSKAEQNEIEQTVEFYTEVKGSLEKFKEQGLSFQEIYTYNDIMIGAKTNIAYYTGKKPNDLLISLNYIDSSGGYVGEFAQGLQGYNIRTKQDALDVVDYVSSTTEAFASYATYAQDRLDAGYPLTDTSLNGMINYLDDVTKQGDSYYLEGVIDSLIDNCDQISDGDATRIKSDLGEAFDNAFFPAVSSLSTSLKKFVGSTTNTGYYGQYGQAGKDRYRYDLANLFGVSLEEVDDAYMQEYIAQLDKGISTYLAQVTESTQMLAKYNNSFQRYINGTSLVGLSEYDEMLAYVMEFAKNIVYPLKNQPVIEFDEMDKTIQEITHAMAYYTKSPLDSTDKEFITINPKYNTDKNELLATIAHEGYPGHLYAYVLLKEQDDLSNYQKVATSKLFGEGWAKYVETQLYDYIKSTKGTDIAARKACDYLKYNQIMTYLLETRLDVGIAYEGWTVDDVATYLGKKGFNPKASQEIYDSLIEIPTTYAAYGYGLYKMYELHEEARNILGNNYDEREYNKYILTHGWTGLNNLEELHKEYINLIKFKNNL
jgi:uncharacterized protein (DUF885 family)